jgi:hypothetical protein
MLTDRAENTETEGCASGSFDAAGTLDCVTSSLDTCIKRE